MCREATLDDVVSALKRARDRQRKCTLLVGAGCSVSGGVPTGVGFVDLIRERFPREYEKATEKTYSKCMAELSTGERRELIAEFVDKAKINWAHIAMAQLMRANYVDRILTTNFDMLAVRACSLVGLAPAIYDFGATQRFDPANVMDKAIFNLHGQRSGFVLINTPEECRTHSETLAPIFEGADVKSRTWVIIGYSGEDDTIMPHLSCCDCFDYRLFWMAHKNEKPSEAIERLISRPNNFAYCVRGFDADRFLVVLAQKLNCFPPEVFYKPFTHLNGLLTQVADYPKNEEKGEPDVVAQTQSLIQAAIERFEVEAADRLLTERIGKTTFEDLAPIILEVNKHFLAGDYETVIKLRPKLGAVLTPELKDIFAKSYSKRAAQMLDDSKEMETPEGYQLLISANEHCREALQFRSNDADTLIVAGSVEAVLSWFECDNKARGLLQSAIEKFESAKQDAPNLLFFWNNLGWTHVLMALRIDSEEALLSLELAKKAFECALQVRPDYSVALSNLGTALTHQAWFTEGDDQGALFQSAYLFFDRAVAAQPRNHAAFREWGLSLAYEARTQQDSDSNRSFSLAVEKFEQCLVTSSDDVLALGNMAVVYAHQSRLRSVDDRHTRISLALRAAQRAYNVSPSRSAYNLACMWAVLGEEEKSKSFLYTSRDLGRNRSRIIAENDPDLQCLRDKEWFTEFLTSLDQI